MDELAGIAHLLLPFEQLLQPTEVLFVGGSSDPPLLVLPVRRDAVLGDPVHLLGADLHLEREPAIAHHRRVQ